MKLTAWQRILAPTDLSPFAEKAVHYAHRLAEAVLASPELCAAQPKPEMLLRTKPV